MRSRLSAGAACPNVLRSTTSGLSPISGPEGSSVHICLPLATPSETGAGDDQRDDD
jgi:hypothetical protein